MMSRGERVCGRARKMGVARAMAMMRQDVR
jgi:hypothetical protein